MNQPRGEASDAEAVERLLGPLGAAVMHVLQGQGPGTVASVLEELNRGRLKPLAYTTVLTILDRLHKRGLVERTKQGRQYAYRPADQMAAVVDSMSARAVDDVLAKYGTVALRQFGARLSEATPEVRRQVLDLASKLDEDDG